MAESEAVVEAARARCDAYLRDRRCLDANLADGVVSLAARVGDEARRRQFLDAAEGSDTPQEKRRFLLATPISATRSSSTRRWRCPSRNGFPPRTSCSC